jgi:hypothetical protein
MFKWIIWAVILYAWVWFVMAYTSEYTPISKQIDLKTMSLKKPDYIIKKWDRCVWSCRNYSSSSSYGGWSFGWK